MLKHVLIALALSSTPALAAERILVQSTTSTANSGLYNYILPIFLEETDIVVNVVAAGTGQAIRNAKNCDGDVLLVHAKAAEQAFVAEGYGVSRSDVMYNDFVIVGPDSDPADLNASQTATDALSKLAAEKAFFASRGDDSGTHKKELSLWSNAGIDPLPASGTWYRETGSGMGATLNVSVGMQAYTMTDRATWISFANKGDHRIVFEGDPALFNQYGVILVDPVRCPSVNAKAGQRFIDWLISERGQKAIGDYRRDDQQLFFPNAPKPDQNG